MHITHKLTGLLTIFCSLIASNAAACNRMPLGWIPEPPAETVHLVYYVGDKFVIGTPNSTDDFCHWRFIFYEPDRFYSNKEGIEFLNKSGIIKFKKHKYISNYNTMELRQFYSCLDENQHVMIFKGIRPGRVIFYMQNKPSWQKPHPGDYFYGCPCSPTIREFVIDII